jgi:hypothetical protein
MFQGVDVPIEGGLNIALPSMARVKQSFDDGCLSDVTAAIKGEIDRDDIGSRIQPGASIAIGVGSRGVARIGEIVTAVVAEVKARGAKPFIFPAMGSHGGATAEGQEGVLANYGITEATVGAPIRATMDTVELGALDDGTPVYMDRFAHEADGVILINRIKPHTNFRGPIESGICKMAVIGMGKIKGATTIHGHGMDTFGHIVPKTAAYIIERIPFLFGVGIVENAYDEPAIIEAIPPENLIARETELQTQAKAMMGRLLFDKIDVLIIDRMGKEISGSGFDPNITGRNNRGVEGFDDPQVTKIVVLDLSEITHGNASGIGLADVITRRLFDQIDFAATYGNVITSAYLDGALIPIVMNSEQEAIQLATKTVPRVKSENARIVRIRDTLSLGEIHVSEPMLADVRAHPKMSVLSEPVAMAFDETGVFA